MLSGISYLTTVQGLRSKIWKASRLSTSKYELRLHNDGRELARQNCFLAHYGLAGGSMIEADFIDKDKDGQGSLYTKDVG